MINRPVINEPPEWNFDTPKDIDRYGDYEGYQAVLDMSIEYRDPILTELPDNAVEGVEQIIRAAGLRVWNLERVEQTDPYHIEIVYFGDDGTELEEEVRKGVQSEIQDFLGPLWRVERKRDDRRNRAWGDDVPKRRSKQRLIVFRMEGRRFKYRDEEEADYRLMTEDRPDGIDEDAIQWSDTDALPSYSVNALYDLGTYESGTGTVHLVDVASHREKYVVEGTSTYCGTTVTTDEIADGAIEHHLDHLKEHVEEEVRVGAETLSEAVQYADDQTPLDLHGDDLCTACRRSWGQSTTDDNGNVVSVDPLVSEWSVAAEEAFDDD